MTRLYLRGELDVDSAPDLDEAFERVFSAGRPIVIDCAGLSYCDSFGIRSVLMAGLRGRSTGIGIRIEHANARVRRILEMSGVAEVIAFH